MCENLETHNHKYCYKYHNSNDRRRTGYNYSSQICKYIQEKGECKEKDECLFSHNYVEQLYRPIKYKSKFCDKFPFKINECEYGIYCSFAHTLDEIRVPLIHTFIKNRDFYIFHFKTVFCPFN